MFNGNYVCLCVWSCEYCCIERSDLDSKWYFNQREFLLKNIQWLWLKYAWIFSCQQKYDYFFKFLEIIIKKTINRTTSIYQPTNAHIISHKTLRHVSILSDHHHGALFLAKIKLQYLQFNSRPASWSSGQSLWLLIMRYRVRFPALPWEFFLKGRIPTVTMVWVG